MNEDRKCTKCKAVLVGVEVIWCRCKSCHNDYFRDYLRNRYAKRLQYAKGKLGGKCQRCKRSNADEWRLIQIKKTVNKPSSLFRLSEAKFELALQNLMLLCFDCYLIVRRTRTEEGKIGAVS